jgi:lipocalin-like protein
MSKSLREKLVGAWQLVSYVEKDVKTGEEHHPMGTKPEGIIMYTPDGYMSAQLCTPDRKNFEGGDMYRGKIEEYAAEGSSYIAYSGPFYVDEAKQSLKHEMQVSLFPNWIGQQQVRLVQVDDKVLHLGTDVPMQFGGSSKTASLFWRRAVPNNA